MANNDNTHLWGTQNINDLLNIWTSRAKPVIIWAGAGLSAPAKLPTWMQLRNTLLEQANMNVMSLRAEMRDKELAKLKAIRGIESLWKAFERLEEELGPASFQGAIRGALVDSLRCPIPTAYTSAWNLGVKGIMTLNIDGLASRAFRESNVGKLRLFDRDGFNIRSLVGTLTDNNSRFIANLHGTPEDPDGWVFTEKKLTALLKESQYGEFVRDCVKYSTIVLLGISAQDEAVIEHFKKTMSEFSNCGPHFWITSSDQKDAAAQVERAGIRVTLYDNTDRSHSFINELFGRVQSYKPAVDVASPVRQLGDLNKNSSLPSLKSLLSETPNIIRSTLNNFAARILEAENVDAYQKFESFCNEYSRAIHAATFVSQNPEDDADRIAGFRAHSQVKEGGFAKVWYGTSNEGEPVAIKVFKHEIREQPELLKAFRRGVRSMRFLQHRKIPGVVRFIDASEIPPVVVMEWIEGVTLHEAVKQGAAKGWRNKLRIANELAKIIYAVHNTPERIIHRDLRPQNVMLRDYYLEKDNAEVVVLDFDLSWHIGALEKSVYVSGGTSYLAPEQLQEREGASTRSAAVDSFGFGMTLYYLISSSDPLFFAHTRQDWAPNITNLCDSEPCKELHSLPRRLARLIIAATEDTQSKRLTFAQIASETERLWNALEEPEKILDLAIIAEECVAKIDSFYDYQVTDKGSILHKGPSNISFELVPYAPQGDFLMRISFVQFGHEKYQVLERLREEAKHITTRFSKHFELISPICTINNGDFYIEFTIDYDSSLGPMGFIEKLSNIMDATNNFLVTIAGGY